MVLQENYNLKKLNSFGINVSAKYFAAFSNTAYLNDLEQINQQNLLVLGGGSNILFTKDFNGLVLKNEIEGIVVVKEDDNNVYVKAGAGVGWHQFVLFCIDNNFAGVENLSLIPGSIGASPMQNIGAYGVEVKDVFYELEAYSLADKATVIFNKKNCEFGYRESVFKNKYKGQFIIASVTFKLNKIANFNTSYGAIDAELKKMGVSSLSIKAISDAVISIRQSKLPDPKIIGNAGSFFKNPTVNNVQFEILKNEFPAIVGYAVDHEKTKLAAGWLIEQCGWKGYRKDDAGCHEKQALVLVNYANASGSEIVDLSNKIIESVNDKFNIVLEKEVNVV